MRCVIVLASLSLAACSTANLQNNSLRPGMPAAEVRASLGEPRNRQFKGSREAWQYCSTSLLIHSNNDYTVVWLMEGKVVGQQSYTQPAGGLCEAAFRTIDWANAPDHTIEHRVR